MIVRVYEDMWSCRVESIVLNIMQVRNAKVLRPGSVDVTNAASVGNVLLVSNVDAEKIA